MVTGRCDGREREVSNSQEDLCTKKSELSHQLHSDSVCRTLGSAVNRHISAAE